MHALLQSIETLVVALAATAFAHFGVDLKEPPCLKGAPSQVVHRVSVAAGPNAKPDRIEAVTAPCPQAASVRRAYQTT